MPWPGRPGVSQLAGEFSLSLLAHGDEAGEEEKGEGETELEAPAPSGLPCPPAFQLSFPAGLDEDYDAF